MRKAQKTNKIVNKNKQLYSASSFRNFLLKDPLIDYLRYKNNVNKLTNNKTVNKSLFTEQLFKEGINFEETIIKKIRDEHNNNFVQICNSDNYMDLSNYEKTKESIEKQIPIIYHGMLINNNNSTYGIPDLLVLSTYINKLYPETLKEEEYYINDKAYYLVIEIKHSTINLDSKGVNVLNSGNLVVYKGQLYIYNEALNNLLNINNKKAFILGKRCLSYSCGIKNIIENKLGLVDFSKDDNYSSLISEGIKWLNDLNNNGDKFKLLPKPSHPNLYPNMKNYKDNEWRSEKLLLAEKIGELTSIWNVGIKHREIAHKNKIYNWRNIKALSKNMGIKESKKQIIIDKILKINRNNKKCIEPNKIINNINNWKYQDDKILELFIDYETLNKNEETWIYMIGVGYKNNESFEFKCFYLDELSYNSQNELFIKFWDFINNKTVELNKTDNVFYHWTKAEPINYNKWMTQLMLPNKTFIDMYDIFINEPIVIKGALNFSLKSIAKAMYNNNMIKTTWESSSKCVSGLDALYWGLELYKNDKLNMSLDNVLNDILYYNKVDCEVLFEIINYLRKNHI